MQRTLNQALNFLRDVPDDEVSFLVEYDVSVLGQCIIIFVLVYFVNF